MVINKVQVTIEQEHIIIKAFNKVFSNFKFYLY